MVQFLCSKTLAPSSSSVFRLVRYCNYSSSSNSSSSNSNTVTNTNFNDTTVTTTSFSSGAAFSNSKSSSRGTSGGSSRRGSGRLASSARLPAASPPLPSQQLEDLSWKDKQRLSRQRHTLGNEAQAQLLDYQSGQKTTFTLEEDPKIARAGPGQPPGTGLKITEQGTPSWDTLTPYSDFVGNRYPTLNTAKNFRYFKERGLNKLKARKFPIHLDTSRKLDPYLREYIFFLNTWDPARFTIQRIAERYRLKEATVYTVIKEFGKDYRARVSGLTSRRRQVIDKKAAILDKKEQEFHKAVGWDQMGDGEEEVHAEDEEFGGPSSTFDWVQRQSVEVESMSAYPLGRTRDPVLKKVDCEVIVKQTKGRKIISWMDADDKVVF